MQTEVTAFKVDQGYVKALLANFGNVVVFIFHAHCNE